MLVGLSGLLSFGRSLSRNTVRNDLCRAHLLPQAGLAQLVEQIARNLKVESSTPPWVMCLSFLLAFARTVVRVLLLEGKCIAALLLCKRIPLKIVYAWPASIAPLQCKGLNLTSASVMGNWTASIAERLLLIYRWTPFPAMSGRDPPKRGPPPHQFRPLPFSRRLTPY